MTDGEDDQNALWESIDSGQRGPVEVIYLAKEEVDLDEIEQWGEMTGWWSLRVVKSLEEAIRGCYGLNAARMGEALWSMRMLKAT